MVPEGLGFWRKSVRKILAKKSSREMEKEEKEDEAVECECR